MSAGAPRRVFLSLGSNLGDRAGLLRSARTALAALPGTALLAASRVYETAPQELAGQPEYLNQVVCLESELEPSELLAAAQAIEAGFGRVRGARFGPRTLDIDILLVENVESGDRDLTIPHPRMMQRAFVLTPLSEIWAWARGMPDLDVAAMAVTLASAQAVRPFDESEADR
jgi:2-amino-4-hydroxy-6-hydroxymethyldihydropteridine diphosphokinase